MSFKRWIDITKALYADFKYYQNMKKTTNKKAYNIHIRVNEDTYDKWKVITAHLDGKTQSAVFRNLINKMYTLLLEIYNIKNYEKERE